MDQAQEERGRQWLEQARREYPLQTNIVLALLGGNTELAVSMLCALWPELKPYASNQRVLDYLKALQKQMGAGR